MLLSRFAALGNLRPFPPAPVLRRWVWGIYTIFEVIRLLLSRFAALGDLRPFSPAPVLRLRVWVGLPDSVLLCCPIPPYAGWFCSSADFPRFPLAPGSLPVLLRSKNFSKNPPAAAQRCRFAPPEQKFSIHAEKPLCIMHNGFFLIRSGMLSRILPFSGSPVPSIAHHPLP